MSRPIIIYKTKICNICKKRKNVDKFYSKYKYGKYKHQKSSHCRKCEKFRLTEKDKIWLKEYRKKYYPKYYKENIKEIRKNNRKYYHLNKKEISRKNKEKYNNDPEFKIRIKCVKYKITVDEYKKRLKKQNNKCAICKLPSNLFNKELFIDHCHLTGKFRGFLCGNCNLGIGYFKDRKKLMLSAIKYLENNNAKTY